MVKFSPLNLPCRTVIKSKSLPLHHILVLYMKVAIVKYNAGNVFSVINAFERLGAEVLLTDEYDVLTAADRVVLPGQGEAGNIMRYLRERGLDKIICSLRQPVLGICIGQHLLCKHSEENDVVCLGVIPAEVKRFKPDLHLDKVPAMGWNRITHLQSPLFKGMEDGNFVYFVHSYYVPECANTTARSEYIVPFSAALHKDNFYATQFHPEKSGLIGERILANFLSIE